MVSAPGSVGRRASSTEKRSVTSHISKDPAAVYLGRKGGLKGGPARAAAMTSERRSEAARKASQARWRQWNEEEAIEALQAFFKRHHRSPRVGEMVIKHGLPSHRVTFILFGGHNKALEAAGLPTRVPGNSQGPTGAKPWTREEAIAALRAHYEKYREPPKAHRHKGLNLPSNSTLRRLFGNHNKALEAAGLPIRAQGGSQGRLYGSSNKPLKFSGWRYDDRKGERSDLKEQTIKPNPRNRKEG
jgi:Homing endonuclease associated repeat